MSDGVDHKYLKKIASVHFYHNLVAVRAVWAPTTTRS